MHNSTMEQLHGDDDAVLLMYLTDELSAQERAAIERRLKEEPALDERLQALRATMESLDAAMGRLDEAHALPGAPAAAVRQVGRAVRQWQADRAEAASRRVAPQRRELRFPWWSYPLTAAAAITFAFLAWWGTIPDPTQMANNGNLSGSSAISSEIGREDENIVDEVVIGEPVQLVSMDPLSELQDLSELEEQLQTLQWLRETMQ